MSELIVKICFVGNPVGYSESQGDVPAAGDVQCATATSRHARLGRAGGCEVHTSGLGESASH